MPKQLPSAYAFYTIAHANGTIEQKLRDLQEFCQANENGFPRLKSVRWEIEDALWVKDVDSGNETLTRAIEELSTIAPPGFHCGFHEGGCIGFWPNTVEDECPVCSANIDGPDVDEHCPGCKTKLFIVRHDNRFLVEVHYDAYA